VAALCGGGAIAFVEFSHSGPQPVGTSPTVAHQPFQPRTSVAGPSRAHRVTTRAIVRTVRHVPTSTREALGVLHAHAPLVEVSQRSAILAELSLTVRVHPRGRATAN